MGPGIAALVMLEYSEDQAGPWFKLMHRLVDERPIEVVAGGGEAVVDVDVGEQYRVWRDWMVQTEERHETAEGGERGYLYNFWIRPGTESGEA
jgi:hypothetical protein